MYCRLTLMYIYAQAASIYTNRDHSRGGSTADSGPNEGIVHHNVYHHHVYVAIC